MLQKFPVWKIENEDSNLNLKQRLFQVRKIAENKQEEFLNPDFVNNTFDPFLMKDMEKAVERIFKAIRNKEKITIHGDYDCDGVCATAVLFLALKKLNANVDVFLPHRVDDGYGLNPKTIEKLASDETKLVVTVDCGVSNFAEIEKGKELGMDFVITDHHALPEKIPECSAVLLARDPKDTYPNKDICGAGIAWKLATALLLKSNVEKKDVEYFVKWSLDLVALATVADCSPLTGENRVLVKYGMKALEKSSRPGMKQLRLAAGINEGDEVTSDHLGFRLAPRVNAAGRLRSPKLAFDLLITDDEDEASKLAGELNSLNVERQETSRELLRYAEEKLGKVTEKQKLLFVSDESFHPGIVGLIAGRLTEKYSRPAIVAEEKDDEIVASCRSTEKFHITEALQKFSALLERFGGHREAAGFTAKKENVEKLIDGLKKEADEKLSEDDLKPVLLLDTELSPGEINMESFSTTKKFSPYGMKNPSPLFLIKDAKLKLVKEVGKTGGHYKMLWEVGDKDIASIYFNGDSLGKKLEIGKKYDLAVALQKNEWNGESKLEFMMKDIKAWE